MVTAPDAGDDPKALYKNRLFLLLDVVSKYISAIFTHVKLFPVTVGATG
jgi:hypothetical protein